MQLKHVTVFDAGSVKRSVSQSLRCVQLCNSMDCSTPGFPVLHHLLELAQTHVHWVSDAIQQFHPLLSPSPSAFSLSQHQGLFQWVSSSHQVTKFGASASASVLPMNMQDWFPLRWTGWISLQSKGLSRVFSNTTAQTVNSSVLSFLYGPTLTSIYEWLQEKPYLWLHEFLSAK